MRAMRPAPIRFRRIQRPGPRERGQSTAEFSLLLIPFLLLLMGVFDLGRGVFYAHTLENAAREGARAGVVAARTVDEICARAIRAAAVGLPDVPPSSRCGTTGALTVDVPRRGTAGSASDPVRVTLSYDFRPVTPLIAPIVGDLVTLRASSTMYVEE